MCTPSNSPVSETVTVTRPSAATPSKRCGRAGCGGPVTSALGSGQLSATMPPQGSDTTVRYDIINRTDGRMDGKLNIMDLGIAGKEAFVSGGSMGMGRTTAELF